MDTSISFCESINPRNESDARPSFSMLGVDFDDYRNNSLNVPRRLLSLARRFRALPATEQGIIVDACRRAVVERQEEYTAIRNQSLAWYPTEPLVLAPPSTSQSPTPVSPDNRTTEISRLLGIDGASTPQGEGRISPATPQKHHTAPRRRYGIDVDPSWHHIEFLWASRKYYIHLPSFIAKLLVFGSLWLFLVLAVGDPMLPGGWAFNPIALVFFSGIFGGVLSVLVHVPPLLGILWGSILLANVHHGNLAGNIHSAVTGPVKAVALTLILMRGGTSIHLKLLRPMLWNVVTLALLPLLLEATIQSLLAYYVFDFRDIVWSMLAGTIMATISPNTVVDLLHLQSSGHGTFGGPTLMMIYAVPFDTAVGIFAATFLADFALRPSSDVPMWMVLLGPLNFIGGIVLGIFLGFLFERMTDLLYGDRGDGRSSTAGRKPNDLILLRDVESRCFLMITFFSAMLMLACRTVHITGAGTLCVITMSTVLSHLWEKRGAEGIARRNAFSYHATALWDAAAMPALFAFVGAMVNLPDFMHPSFLLKMIACFFVGAICRMIGAVISTKGSDLTWTETIVLCVGWVGKASVQATLAGSIYDRAKQRFDISATDDMKERYSGYMNNGLLIIRMSVVMILIGSPISVIGIRQLGRRWVRKDE